MKLFVCFGVGVSAIIFAYFLVFVCAFVPLILVFDKGVVQSLLDFGFVVVFVVAFVTIYRKWNCIS